MNIISNENQIDFVDLRKKLNERGRILVFIDDSGVRGQPNPNLVKNFKIACAILMESDNYNEFSSLAYESLSNINPSIKKFHATEIVNPGHNSKWKRVCEEDRFSILEQWGSFLKKFSIKICYIYIGSDHYDLVKNRALEMNVQIPDNNNDGIYWGFFPPLQNVLNTDYASKNKIVVISKWKNEYDYIYTGYPWNSLFFNSYFYCLSEHYYGLQLADLAAYTINRKYFDNGKNNPQNRFLEYIQCLYREIEHEIVDFNA